MSRLHTTCSQGRLWVSDITYITTWPDDIHYVFCYFSLILDAYTKETVGWSVGPTLDTVYPLQALDMALERIKDMPPENIELTHHSDRGCQYASSQYIGKLQAHGMKISMAECGNPKDNAYAERVNNTMKNELLKGMRFRSFRVTSYSQPYTGIRKLSQQTSVVITDKSNIISINV